MKYVFGILLLPALSALAQNPGSDDFERPALGTNWSRYGGSQAEIVNGHDLGAPDPTVWCFVVWTASTFDADQFSEATTATGKPDALLTQVYVRQRASDLARYGFHFNNENTTTNIPRWEIKYDGVPTAQTRILAVVPATMPAPGDMLRIEVRGTDPVTITGFHNGVQVISATDSAHQRITSTGPAGMVSRLSSGTTAPPNSPIFARWKGGTLGPILQLRRPSLNAANLTLAFTTMTNKLYTVQFAERVTQAFWSNLATMPGTGSENSLAITNIDTQRFYRVRLN
jgi:hypothetical protein